MRKPNAESSFDRLCTFYKLELYLNWLLFQHYLY